MTIRETAMRDSFSVAEIPISSTCIDESGHDRERSMVKIGIVPTIAIRFGFKLAYKFPRTDESVLVIYFLAICSIDASFRVFTIIQESLVPLSWCVTVYRFITHGYKARTDKRSTL